MIPFDNSYARLPERFFTRQAAVPVRAPALIAINGELADRLGIDPVWLASEDGVQVLAGNAVADGSEPLAQAYAGHQFGGWNPQLGDGRALLLGEVVGKDGIRRDIQLKGSGPTPYSRNGDGRAGIGPVVREYLVSEAMHALGIPTTRALAAVTTGEEIYRETALPGAVLTRVAQSHIRVGTFQYFAARQDTVALQALVDHVIARHYPDATGPLDLLDGVIARQAELVAHWMGVGFIHGVMNTDNVQIAGETIDYGPCAFMDGYHHQTVYSSIDRNGRYAFVNQPDIAVWNMAQLATSLLPLMGTDQTAAVAALTDSVHRFPDRFRTAWLALHRKKIGLASAEDGDLALINDLLARMEATGADFTNTFRALADGTARDHFADPAAFDQWNEGWQARTARDPQSPAERQALIRSTNPAYIPRNHRVEQAIQAATQGDYAPFTLLGSVLKNPYADQPEYAAFRQPPTASEVVQATFCGT